MNEDEVFDQFEDEDTDTVETYTVEHNCENCGFAKYYHYIPRGTPYRMYLMAESCANCGCDIVIDKKLK